MLKDLLTNRLFVGALAFFVLMVVSGMLYIKQVERQEAEKLAETQESVKQWNERQTTQPKKTQAPVAEQTPQGHFHADGTFHEGPRETHETSVQPTEQGPDLQQYAQYIPAHLLEAQSLASVDMARSKAAFRAALPEDPFSAEFEKAVKSVVQQAIDLRPGIYDLPSGHLRRVEFAIASNLMTEVSDVARGLLARYDDPSSAARAKEILSWKEPYYVLFTNTTQHEEEENR